MFANNIMLPYGTHIIELECIVHNKYVFVLFSYRSDAISNDWIYILESMCGYL